ncbi:uncharacterized protein KGF55_005808 [Candida pseudojiufengensis]|uniref:uncharacterized protein n=1 Tax=Candida pseudojiufengensis TaxID=497109 RepID=UPI002224549D|nr:uncharacterized protein KGF55_005808 [Candida pseudojiufengensis]KAI5958465.1 hypothetical protein KGF55_005808 [Candida pseudojiufengensis]
MSDSVANDLKSNRTKRAKGRGKKRASVNQDPTLENSSKEKIGHRNDMKEKIKQEKKPENEKENKKFEITLSNHKIAEPRKSFINKSCIPHEYAQLSENLNYDNLVVITREQNDGEKFSFIPPIALESGEIIPKKEFSKITTDRKE